MLPPSRFISNNIINFFTLYQIELNSKHIKIFIYITYIFIDLFIFYISLLVIFTNCKYLINKNL